MRIAYLSVFYPYRGGIAQFNAALYRALEKEHQVRAFNFKRQYPKILFPGKTQLVSSDDIADPIDSLRILDSINPLSYRRTAKEIINYKPDILLLQYWQPIVAPALGCVAGKVKKKGISTISIIANMKSHEAIPFERTINREYIKRNDGIVVLAEAVKRDLLELVPTVKHYIHPHPNYEHFGERIEQSEAKCLLSIPEGRKVLFFFGFIRHYKGFDILLETLGELSEEYYLLAAGENYGGFEQYQKIINDKGLSGRIKLELKYLKDNEIAAYFSAADVCVLPYRSATQSGIVGIAYHFGLPVISTDVGGLREVIEPYHTGMIVDKPEPKLLRSAIESYFNQNMKPIFAKNIGSFCEKYNWDTLAKGIIDFAGSLKK